jgi:hypothetical protein
LTFNYLHFCVVVTKLEQMYASGRVDKQGVRGEQGEASKAKQQLREMVQSANSAQGVHRGALIGVA